MNNAKYSDNFSIMIEKPLSDFDRKTLNNLYLPIVHGKTLNLFYYFHDFVISGEHESLVSTFEKLTRTLEVELNELISQLNVLEAIGLVKTYYLDGMYVFFLKDIPTPSEFFQDEVLYQALISSITKEDAEQRAFEMLVRRIDITKFEDISVRFDQVFEIEEEINHFNVEGMVINSSDGLIIKNENFNYRHFIVFTSALGILDEATLNNTELFNFVNRYSFLYGLNEEQMKDAIACSINTSKELDYELAIKNIKRIYNNKNKIEPKVKIKSNESSDARVKYLDSTTPAEIVRNKYNEPMVASEVATMDELLKTTGIGIGFLNTVLIYVLEERNGEIPTYNYFNKIIQTWKRAGVKTTEDALRYLDNLANPVKKTYSKPKTKKAVPTWYNEYQEENKKNLDTKIETKEENIEDLEEFFKVKEN